jgi:tetratricopeptide (TPR) repeat protein
VNTDKSPIPATSIFIAGLLFLSVIPYAGADVWTEGAALATIFFLGGVLLFRPNFAADREIKRLLAPIFILAIFSFAQSVFTLFVLSGTISFSRALPYSFDPAASFWCALKFLAFAVFVKIFLADLRNNFRFLIWSLIVTGNFFAVLGILRLVLQTVFPETFGWFIFPELRPGIGFATFFNQNHFAFLMLMNLGLNAGLCAFGNVEKSVRFLLFIFSIATWTAIVLTGSRGGIFSSFAVVAVIIIFSFARFAKDKTHFSNGRSAANRFSRGQKLTALVALAVTLVFCAALLGQDRLMQRFAEIPTQFESAEDAAGFSRMDVWQAAVSMSEEHGFFGVGFGGFRRAVSQFVDISGAVVPEQAHNDYLELAASGGAFAALCALWFFCKFFSLLRKRFSGAASRFETASRIGAIAAFAGIGIHSFFDFGSQFLANWLFFAALVSLAVYEKKAESNEGFSAKSARADFSYPKLFQFVLLACLSFVCLLFGYSRLENQLARKNSNLSFAARNFPKIPFDADFYEAKAFVNAKAGNFEAAAENLEKAIFYRPKDYALHLQLAKARQSQNQTEAAENAFRRASELAPRYGAPRFYYGEFLVANGRTAEGFEQLRFAVGRDPQYFDRVFALAWRESGQNAAETIRLLSPLDAPEKEKLAEILLAKKEYAALVRLLCREEDLSEAKRDEFITKLFEKRQISYAGQIFARDCDGANGSAANIFDGGFEAGELREGFGFGWRVRDLPSAVRIGFDDQNKASGNQSLGIIFNGNFAPLAPLVSQIAVVKKNRQYVLSFAYRAEKITTGGVPVLHLIFKQTDGDILYREIKLTGAENVWNKSSVTIQTGEQTDALEIRLTRLSCDQPLCPIFGRLWLDDFVLK